MDRFGRRGRLLAVMAALSALAAAGCGRDRAGASLAQVTVVQGPPGAVEAEHAQRWAAARAGQALFAGDAVRTGAAASAALKFASGREVRLAERSLIRLGRDDASTVHVTVELGQADIEGDGALTVHTTRGPATLTAGTRMTVRVTGAQSRYEVNVGRAVLGQGDQQLVLAEGDGVVLRFGSAEVERYRIEVGAAELEPAAPPPARAGVTPDASGASAQEGPAPRRPGERPPAAFDVSLPAGESAVIHGRQTPVVVRMQLDPPCPGGGQVILADKGDRSGRGRQRTEAREQAMVAVPTGSWSYRYQCGRQQVRSGTLTVRRDGGFERLPRVAPTNVIDADGRRYTVLYQNRLPSLTFTWPSPPASERYTLHLEGKGRTRTWAAGEARLHLASGAVGEGTYQWWFTAGPGRASKRTAVTVRFDNAAVTAQVDSPRDGARVTPGAEIEVAGVAIEGSTVAVGAAPLPVDEQGRFRGRVTPPGANERSIAIRLAHPKSGVHYYVRRITQ